MCQVHADRKVKGICCRHAGSYRKTVKIGKEEYIVWTAGVHAPVALSLTMEPNGWYKRSQGATAEIVAAAGVNEDEEAAWPRLKGVPGRSFAIPASQPLEVSLFRLGGQRYCVVCRGFKWNCVHAAEGNEAEASG